MMRRLTWCGLVTLAIAGCSTTQITEAKIDAAAAEVDFGDYRSETLAVKAWEASADEDYPALFAYTRECVRRYSEEAKRMNSALTGFVPSHRAAEQWALNDVGTCLFIAGEAYADLKMYREASQAFRTLAADYGYSQCWDPKGWFWRPAEGAQEKADRYAKLGQKQP